MAAGRFLASLAAGLLAACQGLLPGDAPRDAGPPTVRDVYVRALTEIGPHRYPDVFIPAVVLDTPPAPLIKPAVLLPVPWEAAARPAGGPGPPAAAPDTGPPAPPPVPRSPGARPAPRPAADEARARPAGSPAGPRKHLAEVRLGALRHAVAFGHRAKESGMDANVEALFVSPDWLGPVWSPRPHLGATLNASTRNTDFVYTGLTWEWAPLWGLFAGLGLGISVHDGMLDNSKIEGKARFDRREFGCRVLFRESLELGYRFFDRHSLSAVWAHHSHGGLCSEENEGIDNAGLRYGYRM